MAKVEKKRSVKTAKKVLVSPFNIYWELKNYLLLAAGIVTAILAFIFMSVDPWDSNASLIISPILLFLAYFLIFPLSILARKKEDNNNQDQ
ncbi:MAG: hypothetical protein AB9882_12580 [Ignavibacteriaceae bacterium]